MTTNLSKQETGLEEGRGAILGEEVLIFLLDFSGSMSDRFESNTDTSISKANALRLSAKKFIEQRQKAIENGAKDNIGVITFGGGHTKIAKVMHDPSSTNFFNLLTKIATFPEGGWTPMASAVELSMDMVSRTPTGFIRIVILSDGMPDDRNLVLERVKSAYDTLGVVFDTVGLGSPGNEYSFDEKFLKEVAAAGGGEYTRIEDFDTLQAKFLEMEQERALLLGKGIFMLPEATNLSDDV